MFCKNCGKELKEGAVFCSSCGTQVAAKEAETSIQNVTSVTVPTLETAVSVPENKQGAKTAIVVIAAVLVVVLTVGGGILFALGGKNATSPIVAVADNDTNSEKQESEPKTEMSETTEVIESESSETVATEPESVGTESTATENAESQESVVAESEEPIVEDTAIHRYELFVEDVTWMEAWQKCREKGGYLVHINSKEEYDTIVNQIYAEDKRSNIFWIGALRQKDAYDYTWVYADGSASAESINGNSLYDEYWLEGEPSFQSENQQETCLNMFYRSKEDRFVWNDAPEDIIAVVSSYAGKVGYICEYED